MDGAVIKRLGTPAFWDAEESFAGVMTKYYSEISKVAMDVAYSDYVKPEQGAGTKVVKKTRKTRKPAL